MKEEISVSRTHLQIKVNTLPKSDFGQWFTHKFCLDFRFKPAIDDTKVMAEISPYFQVLNQEQIEIYRFQTQTTFSFSGLHSKSYINDVMHQIFETSVDEFNSELQKTKSLFAAKKTFEKFTKIEIEKIVDDANKIDYSQKNDVVPYWEISPTKTEQENNDIISNLPTIPNSKKFVNNVTQEQILILKGYNFQNYNEKEVDEINSIIQFYKTCFAELKKIDLKILADYQYEKLNIYLNQALNINPIVNNDVSIDNLFRVTTIWDDSLENGKVRNAEYLNAPIKSK